LALGFLLTYVGFMLSDNNLVPLFIVMFLYMLHTTGELFLSPIGLSMVTKLSPKKMAGTAMGAWFLSFAIANLLGGQIAALTGGGHGGGSEESGDFTSETTVEDGLALIESDQFASWPAFYEVPDGMEVSSIDRREVEISKNITVGKYSDIEDWVLFREHLDNNESFDSFMANRSGLTVAATANDWLNPEKWTDLRDRYTKLVENDLALETEDRSLSLSDWKYYRGGIDERTAENVEVGLSVVLNEQIDSVQEMRLTKYVDVFTVIGLVLLGIALIIIVLNKPLEKLMHGVK